jgi:glycine/D-amino acid oxidase-like deaminating enzyme/nitrite reductase/ring-hydroxylating ferredoxin subunit
MSEGLRERDAAPSGGPPAGEPIWWKGRELPRFEPLGETLSVDTAIVGGGWTGIQLAVRLAEAGQRVAVLERRRVGSGTTGGTTAHLTAALDVPWHTVVSRFGEDAARLVARSVTQAIEDVQEASRAAGGGDAFARVPGYRLAADDRALAELEQEEEACLRVGLEVRRVEPETDALRALRARGALRFERQAEVDPLAHLAARVQRLVALGGRLFEQSPVLETSGHGVRCPAGQVRARAVVHATHTPVGLVPSVQARALASTSYVLAARLAQPFEAALFWDSDDPYHYVRSLAPDRRVVLVGGEDHAVGRCADPHARHAALERWARERLGPLEVVTRWSAELFEPADGLPFIGRLPGSRRQLVAAGFSGTGLTFGTMAAALLADLLLHGRSPCERLFSPARLGPPAGALSAGRENLAIAWRFVADRLRGLAVRGRTHDLPRDAGRVVSAGRRPHAVYRDPAGARHVLSAVCTHMGCVVQWTGLEKTWDCPCHGGRFDPTGKVLYGPPTKDLERVDARSGRS